MEAGEVLGERYRLAERLGRGAMGEVWRGQDSKMFDRDVAVKVMTSENPDDSDFRRVQREVAVAVRISHPGITVVHDIGTHEGRMFIVMELLKGEDLAKLIARNPRGLPVDRVLALALQIADALGAAHAEGIVHRDLKPSNLVIQPGDRLKICDFGIARDETATTMTQTGAILGTPRYMAPEQWLGQQADNRADLYALGGILCEMATGEPPFPGPGLHTLLNQHLNVAPVPPAARGTAIPVPLSDLALALLAKDAGERPATAAVVLEALRAIQAGDAGQTISRPRPTYTPPMVAPPAPKAPDKAWPAVKPGTPFLCVTWARGTAVATALDGGAIRSSRRLDASGGGARAWSAWTGARQEQGRYSGVSADGGDGLWLIRGSSRGSTVEWRGADGRARNLGHPGEGKSGPGLVDVAPAPAPSGAQGTAAVYVLDATGLIWEKPHADWRTVTRGQLERCSAITACSYGGNGYLLVTVAGGAIYFRSRGTLGWSRWQSMDYPAGHPVDVTCWSLIRGQAEVFALDADGTLWTSKSLPGSRVSEWDEWQAIPPPSGVVQMITASSHHGGGAKGSSSSQGLLLAATADGVIHETLNLVYTSSQPEWSRLPSL